MITIETRVSRYARDGDPGELLLHQAPDWREVIGRSDVLILDTETTGLDDRAEVLEVAVVDTTGALRFEALSLPVGRISRNASDVHGLTRGALKAAAARPWPDVWAELAPVLSSAAVVLGWNAEFDVRLLCQTNERHGLPDPDFRFYDLLEDYRSMRPRARHGLQAAVKQERVTAGRPAHRAKGDCLSVLAVMRAICDARQRLEPSRSVPPVPQDAAPHPSLARSAAPRSGHKGKAPASPWVVVLVLLAVLLLAFGVGLRLL